MVSARRAGARSPVCAALVPAAALASLCGCAGAPPVALTCRVVPDSPTPGASVAAALTLENTTDATVTVLGMSVPWLYRHAAHFDAAGFEDPRVLADPREYETLILLPGETAGGEVPLGDRLLDSFGRSLEEVPGTYDVGVRARLTLDPDSPRQRAIETRCRFEVVVPPRE